MRAYASPVKEGDMMRWRLAGFLLLFLSNPVAAAPPAEAGGGSEVEDGPPWPAWAAFGLSAGLTIASGVALGLAVNEVGEIEQHVATPRRAERMAVLWGRQEMAIAGLTVGAGLTALTAWLVFGQSHHRDPVPTAALTGDSATLGIRGWF